MACAVARCVCLCSALQQAFFFFYEPGRCCTLCTHDNMLSSPSGAPRRRSSTYNPPRFAEGPRRPEESLGVSVAEFTTFFFPFCTTPRLFYMFSSCSPNRPPLSPTSSATLRPPPCSRKVYSCKKGGKKIPACPCDSCVTEENRIAISSFAGQTWRFYLIICSLLSNGAGVERG